MKSHGGQADRVLLDHVIESIDLVNSWTGGDRTAFDHDIRTQDAVLRRLQTLAESTQRLSAACKDTRPDIPWARIAGFRNIVVHHYLGVDLQLIWDIVTHDLPPLRAARAELRVGLG